MCFVSWRFDMGEAVLIDEDTTKPTLTEDDYNDLDKNPKAWQYDQKTGIYQFVLPEKYKTTQVPTKTVISFFIGMIPLVLIPALMGECQGSQCHVGDRRVTRTTTAKVKPGFQMAFEDLLGSKDVVKKAKDAKGNVNYAVIQNTETPNQYQILETWAKVEHWDAWRR
jgi:quinol monooxygenase YgiN